jgi:hypothetical protein
LQRDRTQALAILAGARPDLSSLTNA